MDGGLVRSLPTIMELPEATTEEYVAIKVAAEDSQGIIAVDVHGDIVQMPWK